MAASDHQILCVEIVMGIDYADNDTYGVYYNGLPGATSYFAWLSSPIGINGGDYFLYDQGNLLKSVSSIRYSADCRYGGGLQQQNDVEITVDNTVKFHSYLDTIGLSMVGLLVTVKCLAGTPADPDATATTLFTGVISEVRQSASDFTIVCTPPDHNADIVRANDTYSDGDTAECYPATFGDHIPDGTIKRPAKFPLTVKTNAIREIQTYYSENFGSGIVQTAGQNVSTFIVGAYVVARNIIIIDTNGITFNLSPLLYEESAASTLNVYVHVISGTGSGQWIPVKKSLTLADYEYTSYGYSNGSYGGNATVVEFLRKPKTAPDSTSVVQIVEVTNKYEVDSWPCSGKYGSVPELFFAEQPSGNSEIKKFYNLPNYSLKISASSNKAIEIYPNAITGDLSEISSFFFLPANCKPFQTNSRVGLPSGAQYYQLQEIPGPTTNLPATEHYHVGQDLLHGLYADNETIKLGGTYSADTSDLTKTKSADRDQSTYTSLKYTFAHTGFEQNPLYIMTCWAIEMPAWPEEMPAPDSMHVFLDMVWQHNESSACTLNGSHLAIRAWHWCEKVSSGYILAQANEANASMRTSSGVTRQWVCNFPSWYYASTPSVPSYFDSSVTSVFDDCFYNHTTWTEFIGIHGYDNLKSSEYVTKEAYNSIRYILIRHIRQWNWAAWNRTISIDDRVHEAAIGFLCSVDISESVNMHFQGRVFNDAWQKYLGGWINRKTSTDVIKSPCDIIEHVARLGNYSAERNVMPEDGWGSAYSVLSTDIDTDSVYGGYDATRLSSSGVSGLELSFQCFSQSDGSANAIKELVAKECFLVPAISASGKEQLHFIGTPSDQDAAPETVFTLNDLISHEPIEEPPREDLWNYGTWRYCWSESLGRYQKSITISRPEMASYATTYVSGVTSATGAQELWSKCHTLYNKYRIINEIPEEYAALKTIYREADAIWHIKQRLSTVGRKRINIVISWESGKALNFGDLIGLTLPHETDAIPVTLQIESIEKNWDAGEVKIKGIMMSRYPASTEWIDTLDPLNTNYEDTLDAGDTNYEDTL